MADYRDDIERYLRGKMTPAEMHALEKKALDDPFLADALEGASGISPDEFSADINDLKARVLRKTQRSGPIRWYYQAAAAVLLVGVSAVMIFYLSGREGTADSIALNAQREAAPEVFQSTDSIHSSEPSEDVAGQADAEGAAPQDFREELPVTPRQSADSDAAKKIEDEQVEETTEPDLALDIKIVPELAEAPDEPPLAEEQKAAAAKVQSEPPQVATRSSLQRGAEADSHTVEGRILRGRVLDGEDGLPVPGVNVLVKGTATGAVTDIDGYYQITVPETAQTLVFSYIGFATLETPVPQSSSDSLDVTLSPDFASLSEVVVTGYGGDDPRGFEEIKWEPAEPEGGKRAFRRYLETNLRYPKPALENGIEGRVTVQFTIEPTGDLTDFRVVRSLGYGCDEEVIRLIREGPRWKPTKRNDQPVKGKARVKLKFDLPEQRK
ncbi:MAG TPA: TonB family protein [Cyclobacteriaceae bacterium]|jgi:TonB family protein